MTDKGIESKHQHRKKVYRKIDAGTCRNMLVYRQIDIYNHIQKNKEI